MSCRLLINWTFSDKFIWNLTPNINIYMRENALENVIMLRPHVLMD